MFSKKIKKVIKLIIFLETLCKITSKNVKKYIFFAEKSYILFDEHTNNLQNKMFTSHSLKSYTHFCKTMLFLAKYEMKL